MRPIIEFCVSNRSHDTDEMIRELESDPNIDVVEYGCLGNCGECFLSPYVLVNGESVFAPTADELHDEIMKKLKEIEAMDALFDL
jgi:uncharacterized protein YuzB (UPF0349 family)